MKRGPENFRQVFIEWSFHDSPLAQKTERTVVLPENICLKQSANNLTLERSPAWGGSDWLVIGERDEYKCGRQRASDPASGHYGSGNAA